MVLLSVSLYVQQEDQGVDRPPTVELDEEATDQTSMDTSQTNENGPSAPQMNDNGPRASQMNESEQSASQMNESERSASQMNESERSASRLNEHGPRESQMNANNDQRTNDERFSDENSEIYMGKADLYLTEGALSLDELDDSNVRLSWRTEEKPSISAISAYVIEVKTKGGVWREIRRVSPEETEAVVQVADADQLKFRIKAEEKNKEDGEERRELSFQESVKDVAKRLNEMTLADVGSSDSDISSAGKTAAPRSTEASAPPPPRSTPSPSETPLPTSGSDEEMTQAAQQQETATPPWKLALIEKKMELKKNKEEEEEVARRKWSELPEWKRKLLKTKENCEEKPNVGNRGGSEERENETDSGGGESSDDGGGEDGVSENNARFWGVKLKKQKSGVRGEKSMPAAEAEAEGEEASSEGGNYKDGAKRIWGVSLKVTEKGESAQPKPAEEEAPTTAES